jgi:hypothetical protein
MRIYWTVEAHVAAQEREIAIGFGKRVNLFRRNNEPLPRTTNFELRTVHGPYVLTLLPNHDLLPLMVFALNHVQPTLHAPPATASVNQGVAISSSLA